MVEYLGVASRVWPVRPYRNFTHRILLVVGNPGVSAPKEQCTRVWRGLGRPFGAHANQQLHGESTGRIIGDSNARGGYALRGTPPLSAKRPGVAQLDRISGQREISLPEVVALPMPNLHRPAKAHGLVRSSEDTRPDDALA